MRQAVKDILNTLYGKTLERIREAESALVDAPRLWELVCGDKKRTPLYHPTIVSDAGVDSCYHLQFAKEWAPARGLPPCVGAAVLGNSKVRWYTMLEAGVATGMVPVTCDTDSIIFASGRNNASTIVPTMPPRITTMNGSSKLKSDATATSTSSS